MLVGAVKWPWAIGTFGLTILLTRAPNQSATDETVTCTQINRTQSAVPVVNSSISFVCDAVAFVSLTISWAKAKNGKTRNYLYFIYLRIQNEMKIEKKKEKPKATTSTVTAMIIKKKKRMQENKRLK